MRQAHRNPVFKQKESLKAEYVPDHLPMRMDEVNAIAETIEKSMEGSPRNIFIYGSPGTGKTASIKHIFQEMSKKIHALPFYVDCFKNSSRSGALHQLILTIFRKVRPPSKMPSRRGVAYDELWSSFRNEMEKGEINGVVCLDEIDQLDQEGKKILYDLSRFSGEKTKLQIITVTNNGLALSNVDGRIKSSLRPMDEVQFERYGYEEMKEIVKFRVKQGFWEDVVPKSVIDFLAEFTAQKGGDVRIAREALLRAGKHMLDEDKEKMEVEDVRKVLDDSQFAKKIQRLQKLSRRKKKILRMIPRGGIFFPQLSKMYMNEKGDIGQRRLRDHMHELRELGLLEMDREGLNGDYKVTLNVPRRILFEVS